MSKLRVRSFSISIDGFGAGPSQDLQNPLGVGGPRAVRLVLPHAHLAADARRRKTARRARTTTSRRKGFEGFGAWILGPQHVRPRPRPVAGRELEGLVGRRAAVPHAGLRADAPRARAARDEGRHGVPVRHRAASTPRCEQAKDAAGGRDVRLGGGVATIRQYLRAGLVDELHLAISPVLLGAGEHLLQGLDLPALGYECAERVAGARAAAHVFLRKARDASACGRGVSVRLGRGE